MAMVFTHAFALNVDDSYSLNIRHSMTLSQKSSLPKLDIFIVKFNTSHLFFEELSPHNQKARGAAAALFHFDFSNSLSSRLALSLS